MINIASENEYPKSDNDVLYASESNYQEGNWITVEAGENITGGNVVYLNKTNGKAYVSDTGTAADIRADGIAYATTTSGNSVTIIRFGRYITAGLTANTAYYLGASGAISTTKSGVLVGFAASTTALDLKIVQDDRDTIGTVKAYLKSFTGIPSNNLCSFWVECNGQVLADNESPLNGQTIPNLNGSGGSTQRFLRGNTTSGTTGGADTHTHTISSNDSYDPGGDSGCESQTTSSADSKPPYYEVVWIMKVK